jgi:hypothetical protein
MKNKTRKCITCFVVALGLITATQDSHHSFYEGEIAKVNLSKKLSGFDGLLSKEKK